MKLTIAILAGVCCAFILSVWASSTPIEGNGEAYRTVVILSRVFIVIYLSVLVARNMAE